MKGSISFKYYEPGSPKRERAIAELREGFEACRAELLRVDRAIFQRSWWRGLFKAIPFTEHEAALAKLGDKIYGWQVQAKVLANGASEEERRELAIRLTFLARYGSAAEVLRKICRGLLNRYDWKAYQADVARYRQALHPTSASKPQ